MEDKQFLTMKERFKLAVELAELAQAACKNDKEASEVAMMASQMLMNFDRVENGF